MFSELKYVVKFCHVVHTQKTKSGAFDGKPTIKSNSKDI